MRRVIIAAISIACLALAYSILSEVAKNKKLVHLRKTKAALRQLTIDLIVHVGEHQTLPASIRQYASRYPQLHTEKILYRKTSIENDWSWQCKAIMAYPHDEDGRHLSLCFLDGRVTGYSFPESPGDSILENWVTADNYITVDHEIFKNWSAPIDDRISSNPNDSIACRVQDVSYSKEPRKLIRKIKTAEFTRIDTASLDACDRITLMRSREIKN